MRADWEREALAAVEDATRERVVTHEQMVTAVVDALEPLIRADEHQATLEKAVPETVLQVEADLRAWVKALPRDAHARHDDLITRRQVLALLDGSSE